MAFCLRYIFFFVVCSCALARGQCAAGTTQATTIQDLCAGNPTHAAPQKDGLLQGNVVDPADAPIPAFILVHSDHHDNKIAARIPVKADGTFQLSLAPGLYDLFVGYTAFLPIARVIEVRSGKTLHLKLAMKLDEKHLENMLVQ
jgi:hypothetical protein